tara:strand:- start:194 stop:868 length:675 start_codon:yes stop_codon:yes gene_type:complete
MVSPTEVLIYRQRKYLPKALDDLDKNNKKTGHWAWWAFPTEMPGQNELDNLEGDDRYKGQSSSVSTRSAARVIYGDGADEWQKTLEKICELLNQHPKTAVIPVIDHGRIGFFIKFWSQHVANNPDLSPDWFKNVIECLRRHFSPQPRQSRRPAPPPQPPAPQPRAPRGRGGPAAHPRRQPAPCLGCVISGGRRRARTQKKQRKKKYNKKQKGRKRRKSTKRRRG